MKSNIELLAPAGNKENFIGAINAGANAIYLAGKNFGARAYASNFTNQEISELIIYAHKRNVKVFVTVNTIIFENEINDLLTYTDFLVLHCVDALIVQDIGMIELFTKRYPNTEIHASTQMNTYTVSQAEYLKSLGVKRIILARETDIDTIRKIKKEVDIDLEVFIHGALCVSYSGNCLFSALNGGRSGNRGECAQPCRLPYSLMKENQEVSNQAYLMSTKDLFSLNHLNEIIEAGVSSLKIEGRMRSFEYVTQTVLTYKEAINNYNNKLLNEPHAVEKLKTVFNREYTKGYIAKEQPYQINNSYRPNHQGIEVGVVTNYDKGKATILLSNTLHKNDGIRILGTQDFGGKVNRIIKENQIVESASKGDTIIIDMVGNIDKGSIVRKTLDTVLNTSLEIYKDENYKLVPLTMEVDAYVGKPIMLKLQIDYTNQITVVSDYIIPKANNAPLTEEQLKNQFSKLGNTFYQLTDIIIKTDSKGFIPNSVINTLRRNAIDTLENQVLTSQNRLINKSQKTNLNPMKSDTELIVKVENIKQYQVAQNLGIKTIYYKENINSNYIFMSRIHEDIPKERNLVIQDFGLLLQTDKNIITNEHLNIVNSYSVESLLEKGVKAITLSTESKLENTQELIKNFVSRHKFTPPLEVIMYSTPDLMISKYCPITKTLGINKTDCGLCERNQYYLKDSKNNTYPLIRDFQCNIRVLHNKTINKIDQLKYYKSIGIKRFRLDFTTESPDQVERIIKQFTQKIKSD